VLERVLHTPLLVCDIAVLHPPPPLWPLSTGGLVALDDIFCGFLQFFCLYFLCLFFWAYYIFFVCFVTKFGV
jgi:hypothetical protein